jgi:hypothetical protein
VLATDRIFAVVRKKIKPTRRTTDRDRIEILNASAPADFNDE